MKSAYVNGRFYTVDSQRPWAEAVLVQDGTFTAIGTTEQILTAAGTAAEIVDLGGRMVMPGIHDAHTHLLFSGLKHRFQGRIDPTGTVQQMLDSLAACSCHGPARDGQPSWIIAGEYAPDFFGHTPDRAHLDTRFPDQPVFLYDYTIHHGLANTKALELAGLTDTTADPNHGRYVRREQTGELTGEMVEQARWPVLRAIPDYTDDIYRQALEWAVATCHRFGITSVQEASASPQELRVLTAMDGTGTLDLNIAAHLVWREEGFGGASRAELDELIDRHDSVASPHVDTRFVKIWLDGAPLPPHMTQADLTADGDIDSTHLLVPSDELREAITRFDRDGLTVKIHCAGEGSVRAALDAYESVRAENPTSTTRHEIAHCTYIHKDDLERFRELNVVAEMSPAIWHIPEYGLDQGFKFASVHKADATMTVGSDWIITPDPNLFPAVQGMLDRGDESISIETAIEALTRIGARAVGREHLQGSIEVGKRADFIVLDRNLLEIDLHEIHATQVVSTVFEGRTAYISDDAAL
ncbi:amidohydrolase [Rhodococcus opacus]|uniref:Amidohydrolase n=1 Tax=Rhodococcus opacus TaxID=37919 RepID=A0AAX3Y5V7_RHOOP|nr:amidohydrolase [Rhodococcus opacus]MCZ4588350.1 amidohydrolase [Rhodococcus opacus]WLF44471.1 amidohydrolase [Rhodococcus opacus]